MAAVCTALCGIAVSLFLPYLLPVFRHLYKVARSQYLTRHVPGPWSIPLVGCLPQFLALMSNPHEQLVQFLKRYGTTVRMCLLDRTLLIVMDPVDIQAVCTLPALANKPVEYVRFLGTHLGEGLLNINGAPHRRHRKAITPSLHLDILNDFVAVFAKQAGLLVERLAPRAASGEVFNVQPEFGRMNSATILETVLTACLTDLTERDFADRIEALNETNRIITYRALRPWWQNDMLFRMLSNQYESFVRTADAMESMVRRVLNAKTVEISQGLPPPPRRRMAFVDHVLRSKEASGMMSRAELHDELKTFLFVGSSTSMDFMSLIALACAMHQDVQARLQQELDEVFGSPGSPGWDRAVTPDDLPHLQYTERVLREVLRIAPPVPFVFRTVGEDVTLPSGTLLPRGAYVALVPAGTHRLAQHFPDPLRFDPDRHLPENSAGRHPYAFIPFSAGSRNCLGMRYALMLAKTMAATLLRKYRLHSAPDGPAHFGEVSVDAGTTIMVRGGTNLRLEQRA